jgi:hypothetical protein
MGRHRQVKQMRIMNLPPFAGEPVRIANLGEYLKTRLALDTVPWPDHSWRLLAHMAWPNDASRRDLWMAAQIGSQLNPEKRPEGEGASTHDAEEAPAYLPAQNASWEYFRLFGGHALLVHFASAALHDEIGKIQKRWGDVADLLHLHYDMTTGSHMRRRGGASIRKVIDLKAAQSRSKGRSTASSWRVWTEFKDVAHLVAAAVLLLAEANLRIERERWPAQLSAYRIVMLAPEAVLAVGKFFEQYGLEAEVHGRDDPLFDPKTIWRIPDWINLKPVPPPRRKLTRSDVQVLHYRRARRPARHPTDGTKQTINSTRKGQTTAAGK